MTKKEKYKMMRDAGFKVNDCKQLLEANPTQKMVDTMCELMKRHTFLNTLTSLKFPLGDTK